RLRRRFARRIVDSGHPVVLVPSAYGNVSKTGVQYARTFPDLRFLLVCARSSAVLESLPPNVSQIGLNSFFEESDAAEIRCLLTDWQHCRLHLRTVAPELYLADEIGVLDDAARFIRSG